MSDIGDAKQNGGVVTPSTTPPPSTTNNSNVLLETTVTHMAARTAFLAVFIIVGFVGNCVLLATITQSNRLKKSMLNLFVISAATVNLLDCVANMPLILGSTIIEKWDYGDFACRFNAFLILMTSIEMCLSLTLMALDRCVAVEDPSKYNKRLNISRANILIVYTWIHAIAFAFPLFFDIIKVKPFPARYLCSISENNPLLFISLTSLFGFTLPILFNIVFYIVIVRSGVKEKLKENQMKQRPIYADTTFDQQRIWVELNAAKYVGSIFILWCLLQGPYLLLNYIEEYRNSTEIRSGPVFKYPWEVDFAFTWMKFSYPMFLPFITFFWRKEVWQKFKNLILCRKSIQINDASPKRSPAKRQNENGILVNTRKDHDTSKGRMDIPVIFATSKGLHVQSKKPKESTTSLEETTAQIASPATDVITKCDVFGSRDMALVEDDTSDYDSRDEECTDPFSGSDPVIVRTSEKPEQSLERPRSLSMTCYADKSKSKKTQAFETFSGVISPSEVRTDPFQISSLPDERKRKRKKQKRVIQEIKLQNENDSDNICEERLSNDSGRGTVEKKTKEIVVEKTVDSMEDENCHDADVLDSKTVRPQPKPRRQRINERDESNESASPRPRKKRKKKKPRQNMTKEFELDAICDNAENNDELGDQSVGESGRKLPKRPHRLAPLDHKRTSNTNIVDFNNFLDQQRLKSSQHMLNEDDTAFTGNSAQSQYEHEIQSESQASDTKSRKKPAAIVVAEVNRGGETENTVQVVDNSSQSEPSHRRTRTVSSGDSQTTLLGSNTSSDLSGVRSFNAASGTNNQSAARKKRRAARAKSGSQQTLLVETP